MIQKFLASLMAVILVTGIVTEPGFMTVLQNNAQGVVMAAAAVFVAFVLVVVLAHLQRVNAREYEKARARAYHGKERERMNI